MSTQIDYSKLCEQLKEDLSDLRKEYDEYKESSDQVQKELFEQLEDADKLNEQLRLQVEQIKDQAKKSKVTSEDQQDRLLREFDNLKKEANILEEKLKIQTKSKVELENDNEVLIQQNRMLESIVGDLEAKIDQSLEELAMVHTELEDNKNHSQEKIERLKQQLQETEQELFAVQVSNHKRVEALSDYIDQQQHPQQQQEQEQKQQQDSEKNEKYEIQSQDQQQQQQQKQQQQQQQQQEQNSTLQINKQDNKDNVIKLISQSSLQDQENELKLEERRKRGMTEQKLATCKAAIEQLIENKQGFKNSLSIISNLTNDFKQKMESIKLNSKNSILQKQQKKRQNGMVLQTLIQN